VAHGLNANTQNAITFKPGKRANKHQKALWPVRRRSLITGTRNRKRKMADIIYENRETEKRPEVPTGCLCHSRLHICRYSVPGSVVSGACREYTDEDKEVIDFVRRVCLGQRA
jgi:hypothetical protein